jgi:hypothetical protein
MVKLTISTRKIAGDEPGIADAARDRYEVRARQQRIDTLLRRMLDVPPPDKWPTAEDFRDKPLGGRDE